VKRRKEGDFIPWGKKGTAVSHKTCIEKERASLGRGKKSSLTSRQNSSKGRILAVGGLYPPSLDVERGKRAQNLVPQKRCSIKGEMGGLIRKRESCSRRMQISASGLRFSQKSGRESRAGKKSLRNSS